MLQLAREDQWWGALSHSWGSHPEIRSESPDLFYLIGPNGPTLARTKPVADSAAAAAGKATVATSVFTVATSVVDKATEE